VKNIEAQARIGALITWINSAHAMRPIGSIRKNLCSRLRAISDAFDAEGPDEVVEHDASVSEPVNPTV